MWQVADFPPPEPESDASEHPGAGAATPALSRPRHGLTAWAVSVVVTSAAIVLFRATDTALKIEPFLAMAALPVFLLCLHVVYTYLRPDRRIGAVTGGLAVVIWAGLVAGVSALAALRSDAPLIDDFLAHTDAAFGIDTPALVAWVAHHPPAGMVLAIIYATTVPMVFVAVIVSGCMGREARMWQACFVFASSANLCVLLSAFLPAIDAIIHFGTPPDILALLPDGAGRFHASIFEAYRSGALTAVDSRHLQGVVTFPSFHAIMALLTAYALHDIRILSPFAWLWSGLVVLSTIPIGGHYAVDLLAGGVVWGILTMAFRMRLAPSRPPSAAIKRMS